MKSKAKLLPLLLALVLAVGLLAGASSALADRERITAPSGAIAALDGANSASAAGVGKYGSGEAKDAPQFAGSKRQFWVYNFNSDFSGWTAVDNDGNGFTWSMMSNLTDYFDLNNFDPANYSGEGANALFSGSFSGEAEDNWLVSPQVTLGGYISFYVCNMDGDYPENIGVYVSTDTDNLTDFVVVRADAPLTNSGSYYQIVVDLSAYSGQGYVAIRNQSTNQFLVFLDYVVMSDEPWDEYTVTFDNQGHGVTPAAQVATPENPPTYAPNCERFYDFTGWYTEPECVNLWDFDNDEPTSDMTLYGGWTYNADRTAYLFDHNLEGWTAVDSDGDGYNWLFARDINRITSSYNNFYQDARSGGDCVVSGSYYNGLGALTTDNWLISPQVKLGGSVTFWAMNLDENYPETLSLYACQGDSTDLTDFVLVETWDPLPGSTVEWNSYTVDLSDFSGMGRIAFRDQATDMYIVFLDDVDIIEPIPKVIFVANGHGTAPDPQVFDEPGQYATRPVDPTTEDDYTFGGWFTEPECENEWNFENDPVNGLVRLYARWIPNHPVTGISLDKESETVWGGNAFALTAQLTPANASDPTVVWSVSGPEAQLYLDADCTQPVGAEPTSQLTVYVMGYTAGNVTVTAASHENAEISASCAVEVKMLTVYVGDHDSGISGLNLPVNPYYNYSITQQLFLPQEMGTAGTITSLTFEYVGPNTFTMQGVQFYLANVEEEAFSGGFLSMADAQLVYTGPLTMNGPGNVTVVLDTPFVYDGISTLMLAGYDPTNGYFTNSDKFRYTAGFAGCAAYYQSDNTCPTIENGVVSTSPTILNNRSNVEFGFSEKHTPAYSDVEGIELSKTSLEIAKDGVAALTAKVLPRSAGDKRVIWSVEGTAAALYLDEACTQPVGDEATNALKVYVMGLSKGTAVVTAVSAENSAVAASCAVTVVNTTDIDVGDPDSGNASYYLPINLYYNYSLTQQIFEASEIGKAGKIKALTFYYTHTAEFSKPNVSFYLGYTAKSSFESDTDMVSMDQLTLVYNGVFSASGAGPVTVYLDTPFEYNGLENLILCAFQPTGGYYNDSYKFRTTETAQNSGIIYYSDNSLPDLSNVGSFSGNRKALNYHNTIKFTMSGIHTPGVTLLESVALDPAELTIAVDQVAPLTAVPTPADADEALIWSVDNENVALYLDAECTQPVGTEPVNAYTVYVRGAALGIANVTVTGSESEVTCDACVVTVGTPPTGIGLDQEELTLAEGESAALSVVFDPAETTLTGVTWTVTGDAITLYTDAECTQYVDDTTTDATTVYVLGDSCGSATITVTSLSDPTLSAACTVQVTPASPVIVGYSLRLTGVLGLKCYVALPQGFNDDTAQMTFTMDNREPQVISLANAMDEEVEGSQYKVFMCDVYAFQMADGITAAFTWGEGESVSDTTSLETYLTLVRTGEYDDAVKALAAATANYGHYIQPYLANLNGWTVGGKYAEMPAVSELIQADMNVAFAATESKAFSLNGTYDAAKLDSVICYLTLDADTKLTVKVGLKDRYADAAVTVNTPNGVCSVSGKVCKVVISNIAANCLGDVYTVAVTADGGQVISFNISPLSCVHAMLDEGAETTEAEKLALTALYQYCAAAEAYLGAGE